MAHEDKNIEKMEDFEDFAEDNSSTPPELEDDLLEDGDFNFDVPDEELLKLQASILGQAEEIEKQQAALEENGATQQQEETGESSGEENTEPQENIENNSQETNEENAEKNIDISPWEELDENNSVVKKYIFYISKDFVPYIDKLSADERSAYINDAIQIKIDLEDEKKQKDKKVKLISHFIVLVLTFCLMAPIVLHITHKAIMATFENYKYSQENFEKLYRERFAKDKAYMRSVEYNKKIKAKNNSKQTH
ncbi:hypothetical protein IJ425_03880 [bacterium]|nr:hypothetical protein [bacterium]